MQFWPAPLRWLLTLLMVACWSLTSGNDARAQDVTLETVRAGVKERLSLLQTLEVTMRTWTDVEKTRFADPSMQPRKGVIRVEWARDDERFAWDTRTSDWHGMKRFDGQTTFGLTRTGGDPGEIERATVDPGPPDHVPSKYSVLSNLLGLELGWTDGDLSTLLEDPDAKVTGPQTVAGVDCDVVVVLKNVPNLVLDEGLIGFQTVHGWTPAAQQYTEIAPQVATWVVTDWMTVTSDLTGDRISVPKSGRYVLHGTTTTGKPHRFEDVMEVGRFELPASIAARRFSVEFPSGTEVWEHFNTSGKLPTRLIAGGAAGVAARTEAVARERESLLAAANQNGVTHVGTPSHTTYAWVFWALGLAALGVGIYLRRSQA